MAAPALLEMCVAQAVDASVEGKNVLCRPRRNWRLMNAVTEIPNRSLTFIHSTIFPLITMGAGQEQRHPMEGKSVPQATFKVLKEGKLQDITTDQIFPGKNVIVFSVPGAYTPTCTSMHVPRFRDLYDQFRVAGIDMIVCISVNDAYVMKHWAEDLGVQQDKIMFLADGNGQFTKSMEMLLDKSELGFGPRSRRYAMIVRDGKIEKILAEPLVEGDPYDISSAESCLKQLTGQTAKSMPEITIFTRSDCPFSHRAKRWLESHKFRYHELVLGKQIDSGVLRGVAGTERVPQIFINGQHIGGFDDLQKHGDLLPQPAAA